MATIQGTHTTWAPLRLMGRDQPHPIVEIKHRSIQPAPAVGAIDTDEHAMRCMEIWGDNTATKTVITMAGLDAWVYCKPHAGDHSGGDVYMASSCAAGHAARILLADIAGHGQSAARIGRSLQQLMRRHVNHVDQSRFMQQLNRAFTARQTPDRFATAVAATYWAPIARMTISNAGHPRPLLYRAAFKRWYTVDVQHAGPASSTPKSDPADLPLGILTPTQYSETSLHMSEGDFVLMYTDALIETPIDDGRRLGEDGLLALLRSIDSCEPKLILSGLIKTLRTRATAQIDDDLSLILLRPNDAWPRFTLRNIAKLIGRLSLSVLNPLRGRPISLPELRPK